MIILPMKSRIQILKERENAESIWTGKFVMLFISPTPEKNIGPTNKYRAIDFVRLLLVVTKKIHKKAVVRNKFRRRIKEAFKLIDKNLLKNKYDYQILARQSIFKASFENIIEDIEQCLKGEAFSGIPEKTINSKKNKKNNKSNKIKTSYILKKNK